MGSDNKNWFGLTPHPTDDVVYWNNDAKEIKKIVSEVRTAYDKIVSAGFKQELDKLTAAYYAIGCDDTHEQYSEDD